MLLDDALRAVDVVAARRADRRRRLGRRLAGDPARGRRFPTARSTLLEAERRKCEFLERWAPPNARVVWGRAEEQETDAFGVALAKALAQPATARRVVPPARPPRRRRRALARPEPRTSRPVARVSAQLGGGDAETARPRSSRSSPRRRPASRAAPASRRSVRSPDPACRDRPGLRRQWRRGPDLRACESEGRRREDDDCDQPRRLPRGGRRAGARHRPRPAGECDSGLGMRANGTSSYDLLDGAPLAELTKHTQFPNLDLIPSKPELAGAVVELAQREDGERYLTRRSRRAPRSTTSSSSTARRRSAR